MSDRISYTEQISNKEFANILMVIMKSRNGHDTIRETLREQSGDLISRLQEFMKRLIKSNYFQQLGLESKKDNNTIGELLANGLELGLNILSTPHSTLKQTTGKRQSKEYTKKIQSEIETEDYSQDAIETKIDSLKERLTEIPDSDIDNIIKLILEKYEISNVLLLEGIIAGFYDYLREYIDYYYKLLIIQNHLDTKINLDNIIFKRLTKEFFLSSDNIKFIFGDIEGLQTLNPDDSKDEQKVMQVVNNNSSIIRPLINFEDDKQLQKLFGVREGDKDSLKLYDKFQKQISGAIIGRDAEIKNRYYEMDQEILTIITKILFSLVDLEKEFLPKDIRRTIKQKLVL